MVDASLAKFDEIVGGCSYHLLTSHDILEGEGPPVTGEISV